MACSNFFRLWEIAIWSEKGLSLPMWSQRELSCFCYAICTTQQYHKISANHNPIQVTPCLRKLSALYRARFRELCLQPIPNVPIATEALPLAIRAAKYTRSPKPIPQSQNLPAIFSPVKRMINDR